MSPEAENIIRRQFQSLPSDPKIMTKKEAQKLQIVWSEIKKYLLSLIIDIGADVDSEKHLIECKSR